MASAPTRTPQTDKQPLVPPDEEFWQHYSPHGEAPISVIGSLAVHLLVAGVMVLFALYLVVLFSKPQYSLPIEPVRLQGGGGGNRNGTDVDGKGGPREDVGQAAPGEVDQPGVEEAPPRPSLTPVETAKLTETYDNASVRLIEKSDTGKAMARLSDSIRKKLSLGGGRPSAKGQGGTGAGGGEGSGTGTGTGAGSGPGKATLTKRERRMLRWHMRFTASTGAEYLAQLRGLGAILAIPVNEGAGEPQFKIVEELRRGAPLLDKDVSGIERIYWIDDKPQSVRDVMAALGHPELQPSRFVAFMPQKLEEKLFEMERRYVERVLRKKFDEDRLEGTTFRVVPSGGSWKPELINVIYR